MPQVKGKGESARSGIGGQWIACNWLTVLDFGRSQARNQSWHEAAIVLDLKAASKVPATIRPMLFAIPGHELSDGEVAAILRDIIAGAGRYPRHVELNFAGICAEHLVDGLRLAGLIVIRPALMRLTE